MNKSLLVSAIFLFSAIVVLSQIAVNAATGTAVLDLDGNKLETNNNYYILPVIRGRGGGLALAQRNKSCPFYVARAPLEEPNGPPLKFLSVEPKDQFMQLSKDMNFVFSAVTICAQSTVWRLGALDEAMGKRYVTTGGKIGSPGIRTVSNWFKIEKYNNNYKLVICPMVCNFCKVLCGDVGVCMENGRRWLGLSNVPFPAIFKKA